MPSADRYPALKVAVLFLLGILLASSGVVPSISWHVSLAVVAVLLVSFRLLRQFAFSTSASRVTGVLLCVALGGARHAEILTDGRAISSFDSRIDVTITGIIAEDPVQLGRRVRFFLDGERLMDGSVPVSLETGVLVSLIPGRRDTMIRSLTYGMRVTLQGQLDRPPRERNPGEFDSRNYYQALGITHMMKVKGWGNVDVLAEHQGSWIMSNIVLPVRRYILLHIDNTIGGEEGEFLKGILIGERSGMSFSLRESFVNSGTAHVLAVSGSNVAVVVLFMFLVLEFLRVPRGVKIALTCLGVLLYMLLTGSQPPVVRASIMALVFLSSIVVQEKVNPLNTLGVAALIILMMDSRQLFDVGFQLSFAAVLAIVLIYPVAAEWIDRFGGGEAVSWILKVSAVSLAATAGTLPMTAMYFGKVSVIGILANIGVIPAVGLSVLLGFVSAISWMVLPWISEAYAACNYAVLWLTIVIAQFAGGLPFAYIDTSGFQWIHAPFCYAFLGVITNTSARRRMGLWCIFLCASLNLSVYGGFRTTLDQTPGRLRVTVIDVGQGDAVLVESPSGRKLLIDAGPKSPGFDAGERIIVPYLKRRGIHTLDMMVLSHGHADHIGGVSSIVSRINVGLILESGQFVRSGLVDEYRQECGKRAIPLRATAAGEAIPFCGTTRLYVLHPPTESIVMDTLLPHPNLNNTSVVVKLRFGQVSFLFPGDAEREAEGDLLSRYGSFLTSTILKVGHHGSRTSTTEEFLLAVNPGYAVISVGRDNKFRHPSDEVIRRLEERGVAVSRTDEEGAVIYETDGHTLTTVEWRR